MAKGNGADLLSGVWVVSESRMRPSRKQHANVAHPRGNGPAPAPAPKQSVKRDNVEITWWAAVTTYTNYAVLSCFGHFRDFFGSLLGCSRYLAQVPPKGYAPLLKSWENFFTRRLYHRIQDCWNRPIGSSPGARIKVMERESDDGNKTFRMNGKSKDCLNLGSYNYLGFADDWQETCRDAVMPSLDTFNVCCESSRVDLGTTVLHKELEQLVARFVSKEDAIVYNMGYGTNSTTIPALVGKGCLIVSDSLNHTSIVNGSRASGALIRTFKHNDAANLDYVLRDAIARGIPRTHRPWRKILVMVEGIYSMEGEICDLKSIVKVVKKYGVYLYVDEAHSIGALGDTGRGVCEYTGVDPKDIDILMGTFTKSFGAMGGYIAGSRELIAYLRRGSAGTMYHNSLSPIVCKQVYRALQVIMGEDGTNIGKRKLASLRENSNYMRRELIKMDLHVYGTYDSPVIPFMIYNPTKLTAFSRECLARGLAVVVVGFPATPLVLARTRICVSAGHTIEDMNEALQIIREVAELLRLQYAIHPMG